MYNAKDSMQVFDEGSAVASFNGEVYVEGSTVRMLR